MENDLGNYRKSYQKKSLSKSDFSDNPLELFQKWFYEVEEFGGETEVNTMTLSWFSKKQDCTAKKIHLGRIYFLYQLPE
jgi:pyridoxamine 5'-phosphate oxidase